MVTSAGSISMHHEAFVNNTFFYLRCTCNIYNGTYACIHELACMASKELNGAIKFVVSHLAIWKS